MLENCYYPPNWDSNTSVCFASGVACEDGRVAELYSLPLPSYPAARSELFCSPFNARSILQAMCVELSLPPSFANLTALKLLYVLHPIFSSAGT